MVVTLCVCRLAGAEVVDLSKPFAVDDETICLFHLDDVATGGVNDAVAGGLSGKVTAPAESVFPSGMKTEATDVAKSHVEEVSKAESKGAQEPAVRAAITTIRVFREAE